MTCPVPPRSRLLTLAGLLALALGSDPTGAATATAEIVDPGDLHESMWTRIDDPIPPTGSRILFDPASRQLVAFTDRTDEVWARRLEETARWRRIPVQPPYFGTIGRESIVYDSARSRFLLVRTNTFPEDQPWQIWALALDEAPRWTRASSPQILPALPPRSHASVIYDEAGDRLVLYGGYEVYSEEIQPPTEAFRPELWDFRFGEGLAWRRLPLVENPPEITPGNQPFYDGVRRRMLVLGSAGPVAWARGASVWEIALDGSGGVRLVAGASCLGYSPRYFAACLDPLANRLIVDAGLDFGYTHGEVPLQGHWELGLDEGGTCRSIDIAGHCPRGRFGHAAIYDADEHRVLFVGGQRSLAGSTPDREIDELTLDAMPRWRRFGPLAGPPFARLEEAAVLDPVRDRILVTGGGYEYPQYCEYCRSFTYDDVWSFGLGDADDWTELIPNGLNGSRQRPGASGSFDPVHDRLLRFGGSSQWPRPGLYPHDDFDSFPLAGPPGWSPIPVEGLRPGPRIGHAAVLDSRRQRILLLNGSVGFRSTVEPPPAREVWSYSLVDPAGWTRLDVREGDGPSPGASAIYDRERDRVVAVSGTYWTATPARVWTLDLARPLRWFEHSFAGEASPQTIGRAVHDPIRRRTLYFEAARFGNIVVPRTPARVWALEGDDVPAWRLLGEPPADDVPGLGVHPVVYDGRRDRFLYAALAEDFAVRAWTLGEPHWTGRLSFASHGSERAAERSRNGLSKIILSSRSPWSSPIHPAPLDVHALDPSTIRLQGLTFGNADRRGIEIADVDGDGHDDWILSVRPDGSDTPVRPIGLEVRSFDGAVVEARFGERDDPLAVAPMATNGEESAAPAGASAFTAQALVDRQGDLGIEVWTSDESPLRAELFDVRGRRIAETARDAAAGAPLRIRWAGTARLAPGVYLARVRQGSSLLRLRIVRL